MRSILVIQTGGTIDKTYPRTKLGYAFEITEPSVKRIADRAKVPYPIKFVTVCRKDSQDISDQDRQDLLKVCRQSKEDAILITHGTDTMIDTAAYLAAHNLQKTIVITGAFLPEAFKDSDADFNVGMALGALQIIDSHTIFITMNGLVTEWDKVTRDDESSMFVDKTQK